MMIYLGCWTGLLDTAAKIMAETARGSIFHACASAGLIVLWLLYPYSLHHVLAQCGTLGLVLL